MTAEKKEHWESSKGKGGRKWERSANLVA